MLRAPVSTRAKFWEMSILCIMMFEDFKIERPE